MKAIVSVILAIALLTQSVPAQTIRNFGGDGKQLTRFDKLGNALDAHDGEIALFDGVYYLYGTSYDCGFEWGNHSAPFCGFKVYTSADLEHWTDKGYLFNAQTAIWQARCDGKTYGCFRPHVIYNKKTGLYVLWINVYDNRVGYRVFTSPKPVGPFTEVAEPTLAVNSEMPVAGLNNGDHDTFVDDDGTAYLAYTDWRTRGSLVIEKLSDDYLTGTAQYVKSVTDSNTEAPALFKRNGIYYLVYSDPNCGYCSGTGAAYRTAKSPLGPWSGGQRISDNSCGGQPSFVATFKLNSETIFLFGSDLWNHAAKNEALANFYWAPLSFAADGSISPLVCGQTAALTKDLVPGSGQKDAIEAAGRKKSIAPEHFTTVCGIDKNQQRAQSFTADRSGVLYQLDLTTFKSGYPDADLVIELYSSGDTGGKRVSPTGENPSDTGTALATLKLPADKLSWSPRNYTLRTNTKVISGQRYFVVVKSATTTGCYGVESVISKDGGREHAVESTIGKNDDREHAKEKKFKLVVFIK